MPTKPTISQIADLSGVSIATVSRFINHTAVVKGSTARKIMDAILISITLPSFFWLVVMKFSGNGYSRD